jgi:cell division protein FtsB
MLQVDFKALERRIEQLTQENTSIKEEVGLEPYLDLTFLNC